VDGTIKDLGGRFKHTQGTRLGAEPAACRSANSSWLPAPERAFLLIEVVYEPVLPTFRILSRGSPRSEVAGASFVHHAERGMVAKRPGIKTLSEIHTISIVIRQKTTRAGGWRGRGLSWCWSVFAEVHGVRSAPPGSPPRVLSDETASCRSHDPQQPE
jgi:hypothetical protein